MWGNSFGYRALYPEKMQITANFAVPAAISGKFGMNTLGTGVVSTNEPVVSGIPIQRTEVR